ncbi:MAG: rhamnulokinase, partial [Sarcina sp.]
IWDFPSLVKEMKNALKKAVSLDYEIESIGIDSWGVDYGLLDEQDNLIGMPIHYRDIRNYKGMKKADEIVGIKNLYMRTGIAPVAFNTCFQLLADNMERKSIINHSNSLLFIPDLFAYYLTGEKKNEFTIASTSGLLDIKNQKWDYELIKRLGIYQGIFNEIIQPGHIYGYLNDDLVEEIGIKKIPVVAVGCHDTASAVVGTPIRNEKYAFLSSGTWSLLGVECKEAYVNEKTFNYNFTNEGGVGNTVRLLKNINGLWLIQQLKKCWSEQYEEIDFPDIIKEAKKYKNFNCDIDTNNDEFMNTKDIIKTIKSYCKKKGKLIPTELGELAIAIYNGLTNEYVNAIKEMEDVLGYTIEGLNIVGGGIKDSFLCELTAEKTKKKIVTGPVEAAVLGNVLVQALALNKISSIKEGRLLILNSFDYNEY